MIEITNFRQGAILNHNHGVETEKGLTVTVCGLSDGGYPVKVNGVPAEMNGRNFSCPVELTAKINPVQATVITPYGEFSQILTLVWDKKSFRRCNCYLDDHSFLFTELAKQRPARAFDHFYLAALKRIHDKYGFKVSLNCFYHDDHHDFCMKDMPDTWKSEFIDNSDWLRFSFHSYGEFPDRPYAECSAEEIGRDYDLVRDEIVRFAGEASFIPPIVVHWANIHPAAAAELIRRGMKCYSNALRLRVMGGPSLADRQKGGNMEQIQKRSVSGEDKSMPTTGLQLHYGWQEESNYIGRNGGYYDPQLGIFFFVNFGCINLVPMEEIAGRWQKCAEQMRSSGSEFASYASHEQYSFPCYSNYLPDHLARLEETARLVSAEGGCSFVFFNEGVLGNTAWGK